MNIAASERIARVVVGLAAVVAAIVLLARSPNWVAAVLEVLLAVAGLDLVVTDALGHCPLYAKLGHIPKSLRKTA